MAVFAAVLAPGAGAQQKDPPRIAASQARAYVGKTVAVCGTVADSRFLSDSKRQPTFLNFENPYPDHVFTAVVWGKDRKKFRHPPEKAYHARNVCVTGVVTLYEGAPQMIVTTPAAIRPDSRS